MEVFRLINMTDFVLQESKGGQQVNSITSQLYHDLRRIKKYANFLKQPLKLEMFVPVDEDGNVLECPIYNTEHSDSCYCNSCEKETKRYDELYKKYTQAKEKVLFEGFEIYKHTKDCIIKDNEIIFEWMENRFSHTGTTIESLTLSHDNFNLTPNAIKQLAL
jgi:hypothetical protein